MNKNPKKLCNIIEHPVLSHKLTLLRRKQTQPNEFRRILKEISSLLAYEMTRDLKVRKDKIETPFSELAPCEWIDERLSLVAIQRAGMGMLDGMLEILQFAKVGHIGIYRDKFIGNTVEYYLRLPNECENSRVILMDPLLATGDTAVASIDRLKEFKVGPIDFVCILAAPEGIRHLHEAHPDVLIHCLSVEKGLDQKGYIHPGLGDAGDRLYDTV